MTLQDILLAKGSGVYTVAPHVTLDQASQDLVKYHVGALLVVDDSGLEPKIVGILSERDLLYAQVQQQGTFGQIKVADVMTVEVITGSPDDTIDAVMALMTTRRIRHLPVLSEGRLAGIISIGDIVKAQMHRLAMENRFMKEYLRG